MSQLFISDLHLMETREDITLAFFDFLDTRARDAEALYILGDLFEVWLGDDDDSAFNQRVIAALAAVDCPKYVMHGNRDFLLGETFCAAAGTEMLPDPTVISLYGQPVLLMHGDSLCTRDQQYMSVRAMLRDPAVQADLLSKSLPERAAIATGARQQSMAHTRETAADIMDVTPAEVDRALAEAGVNLLIHGHTHRPRVHELTTATQAARRIVLGDWDRQGWFLEVDPDGYRLASFDI